MIRSADFLEFVFIRLNVCTKNNIPQTVATTALVTPVIPKKVGKTPNGNKNKV